VKRKYAEFIDAYEKIAEKLGEQW